MNKNSNKYIIIYSIVMVVVVATILSVASISLQPRQNANVILEKKADILVSIGQGTEEVDDKTKYINDEYAKYIKESYAVNVAGDKVEGADAFKLLTNLKAEYDKDSLALRVLPIFVSKSESGEPLYILPLWGKGLWGPVWGYIALEKDWTTVYGVVFGHKAETPGLGAEIATPMFEDTFKGKKIEWTGEVDSRFAISKGVGSSEGNDNAIDAITGGTITCNGVQSMLRDCLDGYRKFVEKEINLNN